MIGFENTITMKNFYSLSKHIAFLKKEFSQM